MNLLILIGIGGFFGSISRYILEHAISSKVMSVFPFGTFTINLLGAFLLGIVSVIGHGSSYALLGDGFLGAFTTFSTFTYGASQLMLKGEHYYFFLYVFGSILCGTVAFVAGFAIGQAI
jgi:CrcB protein